MTTLVSIQSQAWGQAATARDRNPAVGFSPTLQDRAQAEWELTMLKERLLRAMLPMGMDEQQTRFLRLAAGEAEALAWLTPFPHLFLPVLLEEKVEAAIRYLTRQASSFTNHDSKQWSDYVPRRVGILGHPSAQAQSGNLCILRMPAS